MAVPSVKLGVTVRPPETALSSVTVNVIWSPSLDDASAMVRAGGESSLRIVPVPVARVRSTPFRSSRAKVTVKVSSASTTSSSMVATVMVRVLTSKVIAVVFAV